MKTKELLTEEVQEEKEFDCECGCPDCHNPEVISFDRLSENEIMIWAKQEYIDKIIEFMRFDIRK